MKHFKKKKFTAILFISLLLGGSFIAPPRAHAGFGGAAIGCAAAAGASALVSTALTALGVGAASVISAVSSVPVSNTILETSSGVTATQTGTSALWQTTFKGLADCLVYSAGQQMLDLLTQNIIGATKVGNNGNPSFAVNLNALLLSVTNQVSGGLANQILGISTCNFSPNFNINLANSVTMSTRSGANAKFQDTIKCPFPTGAGNAQEFYSDFSKGGWGAFETALADNGNPFGTALLASQENAIRQQEAVSIKQAELQQANGFISKEVCDGVDDYTGLPTDCHVTTPGKLIQDQLSQAVGTDMQRLGFADTLSKLISTYVSQWAKDAATGIFK